MEVVDSDVAKDELQFTLDSGAEAHVTPLGWVTKRMSWATGP